MTHSAPRTTTTVIEPDARFFDLKLRELWNYRDLVLLLVRRDFVAQYAQTVLGPLWHVLQPLLTTVIFTIVFGNVAKIPTDGVPPFLFYMAGVVAWSYFSSVLSSTATTFLANAHVFGKVYFPRLVMPLATVVSRLIAFSIQFLLFLSVLAWFLAGGAAVQPNAAVLLTPLLLVMLGALALGLGVCVSAVTTRYRDLAVVVGFGVQLLMFVSPVFYPLSVVPDKWRVWALANPVTSILEAFRYAYFGTGHLDFAALLYSAGTITFIVMASVLLFNRVERTFIDTV